MKKIHILYVTLMVGLLFAASAKAQTLYEDNFSGSGFLQGSSPDTVNYANAVWTNGPYFATTSLSYNAGTVSEAPGSYPYLDGFLPVNSSAAYAGQTFNSAPTTGRSGGPIIDGTLGFTETVTGTPTANTSLSLDLFSGTPHDPSFGGLATADGSTFATIQAAGYFYTDVAGNATFDFGDSALGLGPVTLSIVYNPAALTLTLSSNLGTPSAYSQTVPVTAAEIGTITGVGFNLSSNDDAQDGTVNQFVFSETAPVPEPSTWAMLFCGLGALGFYGYRRKRFAV